MVVLPAPEGPTKATNCPAEALNETDSRAVSLAWETGAASGVPEAARRSSGFSPCPAVFPVSLLTSREHRCYIIHFPIAFDIAEQLGRIDAVQEGDVFEFQVAAHFAQGKGIFFFDDVLRQVDNFEDALERDHAGAELDRRARQPLQRTIELTEVRAKGHDGADGEGVLDDEPAAQPVDQRRADRADQPDDDKEARADHGAPDADVAHAFGALAEAFSLLVRAPEQFDQQRPANVERLVHVGVHGGVLVHGLAGDVAQHRTQTAGNQDEERHDQHADDRQPPLEGQHDGQDGDRLHDIGDDAGDGVADGVLRADHVVVQA